MGTTALQLLDFSFPVGNLEAYVHRVNQIPLLTVEEEHTLAVNLQEHQDLSAAHRLVLAHLRFVVKVAKGYIGYGLALADLIQEGNIGLMKAVKRFNPSRGVRLVSFAIHWIKAEIHEFILRNYRIAKIATTKLQRKLFFNRSLLKKTSGSLSSKEVDIIAHQLKVKTRDVYEMESRLSSYDVSYDGSPDEDEETTFSPACYLTDGGAQDPAVLLEGTDSVVHHQKKFQTAFEKLDSRSQMILKKRWLCAKKTTLQTLADELKVTAERVRQLEQEAITKLKTLVTIT